MSVTVNWLLAQNIMEGFSLLAGSVDENVPVTGINIMDNPDTIPWLAEGTLVLSTGYLFTEESFTSNLIKSLVEKKCSGLGIKMNRYIKELPESMIQQSNQLHFPIFSIPFSSSMDQIANLIYRTLYQEEMNETEKSVLLYKDITECVLKRQSLSKLLPIIGNAVKASVFLTNDSFELIEFSFLSEAPHNFPFSFSKDPYTLFSEIDVQYLKNQYRTTHLPYISHSVSSGNDRMEFELFPVLNKNNLLGYLVLLKEPNTTDAFNLIENIQTVLCIALMNHSVLTENERSSRDIFFHNLLSGDYSSAQEIEPLCVQNHFDFQKERACIVMHIDEYEQLTIAQRRAFERKVFSILTPLFKKYEIPIIRTVFQTSFVLFLFTEQNIPPAPMDVFSTEFAENCYKLLHKQGIRARIGISKGAFGSSTIYGCYRQALQALEIGPSIHKKKHCFSYYQDQIYHRLINHYTRQELQEIYDEFLGVLEKYDEQNQSELLLTLKTYMKFSCNTTQTAKELFIHRNTMFYRLEQIRQQLHVDLSSADIQFQFQMGFYIQTLLS